MLNNLTRVAVSVLCDDTRLPEYDIRALDDKTAACYVASEVGKSFSIVYENRLSYGLLVCIHFDGALVGSYYSAPGTDSIVRGAQVSSNLERPFLFSRPARLGDGDEKGEYSKTSYSGTIQVDFYRYAAVWECDSLSSDCSVVNPVLETTKRSGSPRIQLGDAINAKPRPQIQGHVLDPMGDPYTRFIFHYSPRDPRGLTLPLPRPLRIGGAHAHGTMTHSEPNTPVSPVHRGSGSRFSEGGRTAVEDRPMQLHRVLH